MGETVKVKADVLVEVRDVPFAPFSKILPRMGQNLPLDLDQKFKFEKLSFVYKNDTTPVK
jgi:hypothetical protein